MCLQNKICSQKKYSVKYGSSFSVAYLTAYLLRSKENFTNKKEVLSYLNSVKPLHISNCAVFPVNKENMNLLRNAESLCFNISNVYDVKYSGKIGKELTFGNNQFMIQDIFKCKWNTIDSIVIGHVEELSKLLKQDIKTYILDQCLKHRVNAICYDDNGLERYWNKFKQQDLSLISPDIDVKKCNKYGRLYQHKTPILSVFGTSSRQGKFTLQLTIKRILEGQGIKIGFLSTEPNGMLMGANAVFTIGYATKASSLSSSRILELANEAVHKVDILGKDLIITGSQSGFLPQHTYNTSQINFDSIAFLLGCNPDAIFLVVNIDDDLSYIEKSIKSLEGISNAKVILIAINNISFHAGALYNDICMHNINDLQNMKNRLCELFKVPIIILGEIESDEIMLDTVKNFFGEDV